MRRPLGTFHVCTVGEGELGGEGVGGATAQWVTRRSGAWVSPLKVMVRKRGGVGGRGGDGAASLKDGGKRATDEEEERIYLRLNTVHPLYPLSLVCFLWSRIW